MANFIAIIDPDSKRRENFIKAIEQKISPMSGLITDSFSRDDFCIIWASGINTPVSKSTDEDSSAVIFGTPLKENNPRNVTANDIIKMKGIEDVKTKCCFNGFFSAIIYNQYTGISIWGDLLGVFPIYYYSSKDFLLAGSSPELFRNYPGFKIELNPGGLVSILLTMHIFDGHTLLKDVKRLGAGNILVWKSGKEAQEHSQYKIQMSSKNFSLPFSAHVDILHDKIEETIARHTSCSNKYSIFLSGGLDSRILAGYLDKRNLEMSALTFGDSDDIEMRCASAVAKQLGIRQNVIKIEPKYYPVWADLQSRWEHISNGFNNILSWNINSDIADFEPRVVLGHSFDAVIGTSYINWAYSPAQRSMSFESFFENINKWAFSIDKLKKLLRSDVFPSDILEENINCIKNTYNSFSDLESQRAWCFNLYNRQRHHVGNFAWATSFKSWPVIPALDRQLLETAASMPASSIAERRAEIELLCSRFPKLANLPIDRNGFDTTPLKPRVRYLVAQNIYKKLHLDYFIHNGKAEHLFYYRIYDFNGPGWIAIRKNAEPYREKLYHIFDRDALNELLPGPDVRMKFDNGIIEPSGLKSLIGLMLWSKKNL
jgi:asparagine synthase (glutamine-hydrolysing)